MKLRKLKLKDAPLMLEWMHDDAVTENLNTDFASKSMKDCENFISHSEEDKTNIHLAIVDDEDEYMGTVSLKNIENETAEFAITIRSKAMGCGYSWYAMETVLNKALGDFGLKRVYWCVSLENKRAISFYDKHSYNETFDIPLEALERYKGIGNLRWYSVSRDYEGLKNSFS